MEHLLPECGHYQQLIWERQADTLTCYINVISDDNVSGAVLELPQIVFNVPIDLHHIEAIHTRMVLFMMKSSITLCKEG